MHHLGFVDWILELDQSHALLYREKMRKYEKEDHVSYINTFERLARDEERLHTEEQRKRAEQAERILEQERHKAEQQRQMLEQEQQRAAQQQQMLEQEQQRAAQQQQKAEFLAKRLRELGEDPSSLLAEIEAKGKEQ